MSADLPELGSDQQMIEKGQPEIIRCSVQFVLSVCVLCCAVLCVCVRIEVREPELKSMKFVSPSQSILHSSELHKH